MVTANNNCCRSGSLSLSHIHVTGMRWKEMALESLTPESGASLEIKTVKQTIKKRRKINQTIFPGYQVYVWLQLFPSMIKRHRAMALKSRDSRRPATATQTDFLLRYTAAKDT